MNKRYIVEFALLVVCSGCTVSSFCLLAGSLVYCFGNLGMIPATIAGLVYIFFVYNILFPLVELAVNIICKEKGGSSGSDNG